MSKEKIFALLSAQAGDFVSGEDISAQLGISRAAVWKAVGALRRDGYTIEAQTGLGYRLADSPDVLSERELRRRLGETKIVGRTLDCFESVDSTNSYLKRIAAEGAPDGAVAVADEQTAGRGRRGRSFSSGPGRGVYLSALLRPQLAPESVLPLTALGAVAACDAVERTCGVRPQIKWTNDLVLNGKKLSGTLTELSLEGESGALQYAVIDPVSCTGCGWCAMFCPVECMFQRPDGFYDLDVERCIGCRSCKVNCFYDAITMIQRTRKEDN